MDDLGEHILADAGLAGDQHGQGAGRELAGSADDPFHGRAGPNHTTVNHAASVIGCRPPRTADLHRLAWVPGEHGLR